MAQQVDVSFVDDLDGREAEGTVSFALDGATYEIDLSARNGARLREILAPFVSAGRRTGGAARAPRRASGASDRARNQAVREWAQTQGLGVSTRGRLPSEVVAAYEARNAAPVAEPASAAAPEPVERPRRRSTVQQPTFSSAPG
ncbi:MAG: Lsr2 family protein [Pseudonocardia sp.]|uniref:histone-like nucleoid-structuring protein Lsr2 n=1 Tax=Pseudonocardia sp. TaxID=60912 RepID=UPI001AD56209|nr:Lsr2 family protein [Pseudonocardia sp.]MBN9099893.1 Lsr2 family protein [Pseudonocardia sp.]